MTQQSSASESMPFNSHVSHWSLWRSMLLMMAVAFFILMANIPSLGLRAISGLLFMVTFMGGVLVEMYRIMIMSSTHGLPAEACSISRH